MSSSKGWVVDAETKTPVPGVVIFLEYLQVNSLLGEGRHTVAAAEGVTDEQGYFSVPDNGWAINWQMFWATDKLVTVFKSGYKPISSSSWGSLIDHDGGMPPGTYIWKFKYGKPYILLKRYKNLEEMIKDRRDRTTTTEEISPGSDVKLEKWKLLREELSKEYKLLFPERNLR
jgi:hypothetical protein